MLTTQFFAMKIQRYMHDHGISDSTLAKVASKAFRNGALNPNAWRRQPLTRGGGARLQDGQPPADAVHVLLAGRGRRGARPAPRPSARSSLHRTPDLPALGRLPDAPVRLLRGLQPLDSRSSRRRRRRPRRRRPRSSRPASAPRTSTSPSCRTPSPARRSCTSPRRGLVPARRAGGADPAAAPRGSDGRLPINTDGGCLANGEPIGASGLRQVYEIVLQLRGEAGERQVAGAAPRRRSRTSTAPPASAPAPCSAAETWKGCAPSAPRPKGSLPHARSRAAIVSGASRGIGFALAEALGEEATA